MGVGVFCEPYRAYPSNYRYWVDTAVNPTWGLVFGVLGVWCLVFGVWCLLRIETNHTPSQVEGGSIGGVLCKARCWQERDRRVCFAGVHRLFQEVRLLRIETNHTPSQVEEGSIGGVLCDDPL